MADAFVWDLAGEAVELGIDEAEQFFDLVVEEVADGAPGVEDDGGLAAEVEADDGGGVCLGPLGEGEEGFLEGELVEVADEGEGGGT